MWDALRSSEIIDETFATSVARRTVRHARGVGRELFSPEWADAKFPAMADPANAQASEAQPLRGTRVVSIAVNVPGPIAAARLASMGADVTKVEPPTGDFLASAAAAWYEELARGQRVVTIDLKTEAGLAELGAMLDRADVFIVSSRPSALARLGLAQATVRARYTRLCTVSIVGHRSPGGDRPGHDLTYQAEAGLVSPGAMPPTLFSDVAAGIEATAAALALLLGRERTGVGGWREVALADAATALAAPRDHGLTVPGGVLGGGFAGYALYAAADGVIAIAALESHFMARLVEGLEIARGESALVAAKVRERRVDEWVSFGRAHDIPIAAVSRT